MFIKAFISDLARYFFYFPYRWIVNILPLDAVFAISRIGAVAWSKIQNSARHRRVIANLEKGLGDRFSAVQIKKCYIDWLNTHILVRTGFLLFPSLAKKNLNDIFDDTGKVFIDEALRQKRGVICVSPHLGPLSVLIFWIGRHYNAAIIRILHEEHLDTPGMRITHRLTQKLYKKYMPAKLIDPSRRLIVPRCRQKILEQNGILSETGDATGIMLGRGKFIKVPFLGKQVFFPVGPFLFALRTKAPIVPVFVKCDARKFKIVIEAPIQIQASTSDESKEETVRKGIFLFAKIFEKHLLENPGNWLLWELFEKGRLICDE